MHEPNILITCKNLDFSFPGEDHKILKQLNFEVTEKSRIGLMGENGSGKSTLLKILIGLLHPAAGELVILGRHRNQDSDFDDVRQRVGFLFQDSDNQLFCPTVFDDVMFGPLNQGLSREEASQVTTETLEKLGLQDYAARLTYRLSGGEKRMVALATLLSMRPDILLLDEPDAGLSERARQRAVRALRDYAGTLIVVSQSKSFLRSVTRERYFFHQGRLQDAEPVEE